MNKYNWRDKDLIVSDLKQCVSIADFLKKQQMSLTSGNYGSFKKWTQYHNIKTEDFFKEKNNFYKLNSINKTTVSLDDLCIDSKINKKQLIGLIKKHNLLIYQCSCGNKGVWNNKPLTLQLEHKNGNNTDNRISNLEYLCPNCHSQTQTYGSKNKHKKIFETRCKDLIKHNNKKLEDEDILDLSRKWEIEQETVIKWINSYKIKFKEYNINIIFKESKLPVNIKDEKKLQQRLEDLKKINNITKKDYKTLSLKWDLKPNTVRNWIRINAPEIFKQIYNKVDIK